MTPRDSSRRAIPMAFFAVSGADDAADRRLEIDPQQIEGPPVVFHDDDGGPGPGANSVGET